MGQALAQRRQQRLERLCESDVVFFINHLKTFDPRTKSKDIVFKLYPFQEDYAKELADKILNGGDLFVEKSRDMGISWVTLAVIYWCWKYHDGFQALLGSRKEDYVDNWTLKSLFPKIEYMINNDPFPIKGWNPKKHRLYMKILHPTNGSVIEGESANANFSRAGRYNVIFFDELAFWPFAQSSWESAGDATPCRIAVTTPSEQPSYAKGLRNSGIIEVKTMHWTLHPFKNEEWYQSEKKRRTADEVARELDINWEGSITGIVYPEVSNSSLGNYPYVPNWPLYVSWDFGLDGTAIGWWQVNPQNGKRRRIDSFFKADRPIHYFMPLFTGQIESGNNYSPEDLEAINVLSGYKNAIHYGDPDVEKRSYQSRDMTSTREVLQSHGIYVQTNPVANDLESRKTETKRMLQEGIEINDTPRNRFFMECIKNARYPKREESSQSVSSNVKPIHDWTSHHRTEMEYFAVNYPKQRTEPAEYRTFGQGDSITGFGKVRTFKHE